MGVIAVGIILFLVTGLPIAFTIGFSATTYLAVFREQWMSIIPLKIFAGIDSFVLMAVPFFILAGEIMSKAQITDRLVRFADALVGHWRGGLAQVNVVSSMFFGGITGAALSDVAALGSIFIPAMEENGYDKEFSAAVTASSAIQGPIIPPSIIIVLYGAIMGVSIGALFAAGLIPGILIGLTDCVIVAWKAKKRNYPRKAVRASFVEMVKAFFHALPALILPGIILGGILGGVFTPTEAAAVAVLYGFGYAVFVSRNLRWVDLREILARTAVKSATLFLIIAFAAIFAWVLSMERVPQQLSQFLFGWSDNKYLILFAINLLLLFVGTWMEAGAALILLGPVIGPPLIALGIHPVHLGMVIVVNLVIGLITPPLGVCLYAAAGVAGVKMESLIKEIAPLLVLDIGVLFLITYVPEIVMFLPRLLGYV